MVLNLFPKRDSSEESGANSSGNNNETSNEEAPKAPARRRTRRPRAAASNETETRETRRPDDEQEERPRRRRAAASSETETRETRRPDDEQEERPRRRRATTRSRKPAETAEAATEEAPQQARQASARATQDDVDLGALLKTMQQQTAQLARLIDLQEAALYPGDAGKVTPARVGIFVDAANVELAADRVKKKIDWNKVVELLTKDRRLIRAVSYSPTHDDPGVSMETQRFVEPFLDSGFKIVTKPLKRFADGSIKANVDIELALDIMSMAERLDIVCLVSGDGDFQHLVEVVQSRGVRVEVVGYGKSVAGALRRAADEFIDIETVFGGAPARRERRN